MAQAGLNASWARLAIAALALAWMAGCKPSPQPFDPNAGQPQQYGAQPPSYGTATGTLPLPGTPEGGMLPQAGRTVKVGLLVPLTGRASKLGASLRDAGILALFDKYSALPPEAAATRVELIIKDTKGQPEGARQAAAEAVNEGAELLIGPLFGQSVEAIKPLAATGKIAILSFSNNADVAGNGVYVMGFDPKEQAGRIAQYTYMQNKNRIAVLAPNDAYGTTVIKEAEAKANLLGRKVVPVVRYAANGISVEGDVQKLVAQSNAGGRLNFDALLLPEGGEKLTPLLAALAINNITPQTVQFIGTGLWDDRDLIRRHNLNNAWLASGPPDLYTAFEQRFMNTYDYKPPRIASLAYDGVALAATLALTHSEFNRATIEAPAGYSGPANGIFRFLPNGRVERGLSVLRVANGRFEVLDPPPAAFAQ